LVITQKERPATVRANAGLVPVQLRFATGLTSDQYVTRQAWRQASLTRCPLHPRGGCRLARHGTYARVDPPGTRIARWYCPEGHRTFSLLPDHLAARFPGTLSEIEQVVAAVEQASSLEAAADGLRRDDVSLPSAVRWVRRRVRLVRPLLTILVGLLPQLLLGCAPTPQALGTRLGTDAVLLRLRTLAQPYLQALPRPLGFAHRHAAAGERKVGYQHDMGPDPPAPER
jgi:hypothetical protein